MALFAKDAQSKAALIAACLFILVNSIGATFLYQGYLWSQKLDQQLVNKATSLTHSIVNTLPQKSLSQANYQQLANRLFNTKSIEAIFFSNSKGSIIAHVGAYDIAPNILAKQGKNITLQTLTSQRLYISTPILFNKNIKKASLTNASKPSPRLIIAVSTLETNQQKDHLFNIIALAAGLLFLANLFIIIWFIHNRKLAISNQPAQVLQQKFDKSYQQLEQSIVLQRQAAQKTQQEALKTSEIKSQFIANMSHEIRTPLNSIVGFTDLLLKTELNQRQQNFLSSIKQSSYGLLQIINDILDFSKMEVGKISLDLQPVNLRNILEDVLTILAPAAHKKCLELIPIIYPNTPIHIQADPKRLGQILTNLISNAIKFTHKGSIVVRVNIENQSSEQATIKISVADTGIGISQSQQKRLFRAFTQADTSTTRQYEGTGLGLVIAKQLSEQMFGDIGVESQLNHGSNFWFTFKARVYKQEPSPNKDIFHNRKVVIYDTYPLARLSLQNTLTQSGFHVSSTNHIEQLIAYIDDKKSLTRLACAIINLDFSMEKSKSFHRIIDQLKNQHQCPVILLYNSVLDNNEELINHANIALAKPVRYEELHKALLHLIESPQMPLTAQKSKTNNVILSHSPSILAVDDNMANLKLAEALLQEIGANVTCATSGRQALALLANNSFDTVFMDIQMPEMDGVETTHIIRNRPSAYRDIPIIALTAHALESEKKQLLASGMDDYLSKPVTEEQLINTLLRWTDARAITANKEVESTAPSGKEKQLPLNKPVNLFEQNSAKQVVDIELGIKLAGGKPDLAKELFEMLVSRLEKDANAIQSAYTSKNNTSLLQHVHHLHGATRYCGVPALQHAAEQLEKVLKGGEKAKLKSGLQRLLKEIERIQTWAKKNEWATPA